MGLFHPVFCTRAGGKKTLEKAAGKQEMKASGRWPGGAVRRGRTEEGLGQETGGGHGAVGVIRGGA